MVFIVLLCYFLLLFCYIVLRGKVCCDVEPRTMGMSPRNGKVTEVLSWAVGRRWMGCEGCCVTFYLLKACITEPLLVDLAFQYWRRWEAAALGEPCRITWFMLDPVKICCHLPVSPTAVLRADFNWTSGTSLIPVKSSATSSSYCIPGCTKV